MRSGERWVWDVEGHFPAEPIFLATPDGEDEDDGVLLRYHSPTTSTTTDHHHLLTVRVLALC